MFFNVSEGGKGYYLFSCGGLGGGGRGRDKFYFLC